MGRSTTPAKAASATRGWCRETGRSATTRRKHGRYTSSTSRREPPSTSRYVSHYDADAPPSGGGVDRKVIVFVLRRVRGTVPLPAAPVDLRDSPAWVKKVTVEQHLSKEVYSVNAKPYRAQRREQKLVKEFEEWLVATGHSVCSLELHAKGEASAIRCDLFDETDNAIVEAKSSIARPAFRMAIGQLLDYTRLMKKPPKQPLILVPEEPRPDLLRLAASQNIGVIWPDGDGGFVVKG